MSPFTPVSIGSLFKGWLRQFVAVVVLTAAPTVAALFCIIYSRLPWLGIVAAYGVVVAVVVALRRGSDRVEVDSDLTIRTVSTVRTHPELLRMVLIVNGVFAFESFLLYLAWAR